MSALSLLVPLGVSNNHGDVIKWKHFPRNWPFVRGIHRSTVNSPHKGQWRGDLMFSLIGALNKQLNKQSLSWWFETPMRSLRRHCNGLNLVCVPYVCYIYMHLYIYIYNLNMYIYQFSKQSCLARANAETSYAMCDWVFIIETLHL